uniref:SDR family NAD(P)-dependent oxidoreductase n=1 Tax=Cupriavidus necator TaxID=106590 RepID=UPI003F493C69
MELKGKTAIVTGSAGGIGQGIACVLAREGANVVVNDLKAQSCEGTVNRILASGGQAMAFEADVTNKAAIQAMVNATVDRFGSVDILVNNAAIEDAPQLAADMSEEQWDRVMGVDIKGVFLCCQAVIPQMTKQKKGRIINIGSIASLRMTIYGSLDYTVAKHGVVGLTNHLAWELADAGITVNTVCPGGVLTPMMINATTPEYRDAVIKRMVPIGRYIEPEEIGEAVSFLASDRAAIITGQSIAADGGLLTGYGEDLRPSIRKRMVDMQVAHLAKHND